MSTSNAHILVVDDNPATLYSTSRVLRGAGWTVSEAETGFHALEIAKTGVDLVVLDVNLPDIDGFEVCRRIRADEALARLPVVHLSATFVQASHKVQGLESGADGYLTHPIEPPVLVATVNAFLRARQAEIDLRQSEARFKAVFDNAPNGVALVSEEFVFLDVNPAMCKLIERNRDAIVGHSIHDFVSIESRESVQEGRSHLEQHGAWRGHLPLLRSNGQIISSDWNMSIHTSPGLRLAIVSDITERIEYEQERERLLLSERAARAEAEHANQHKDDFLATLSHELRTPLNAILGWSQLLQMGKLSDQESKDALETIERNVRAQADMIADLLDVSRITSGKIRLELETVDVKGVIEGALVAIMPTANEKSIGIKSTLDPQAKPVTADPARLQQVIWNLVNNAVKFTHEGGEVEVVLQDRKSLIEIRVSDNGVGMDPALLPQIFDRFRQGDASTTREQGGLGLGLAIVKQLVEMHGGTVFAESPGAGLGATFTVQLPASGARIIAHPERYGSRPITSDLVLAETAVELANIRVLLVEDDPDSRKLLTKIILDCNAEVLAVDSVASALSRIDHFSPHVLVSDLGMPLQDGFELVRTLRARGYTFQKLPAIALTAFAHSENRLRCLMAGFQIHLAKPIEPRELTAAIAALVGRTT